MSRFFKFLGFTVISLHENTCTVCIQGFSCWQIYWQTIYALYGEKYPLKDNTHSHTHTHTHTHTWLDTYRFIPPCHKQATLSSFLLRPTWNDYDTFNKQEFDNYFHTSVSLCRSIPWKIIVLSTSRQQVAKTRCAFRIRLCRGWTFGQMVVPGEGSEGQQKVYNSPCRDYECPQRVSSL